MGLSKLIFNTVKKIEKALKNVGNGKGKIKDLLLYSSKNEINFKSLKVLRFAHFNI
jgi:hypothetical protein